MERVRLETWPQVGDRVAIARQLAGFSQRELGDRLGRDRSAIARIEQGKRHLDALELAQLADALGRSMEWFLTHPTDSIASHRARRSADHDAARLEEELERVSRDVELLVDIDALSVRTAQLQSGVTTVAEAEAGAQEARSLVGLRDGPLRDLQAVVERVGLLGFSLELGPNVVAGGYLRLGSVGVALINGTADAGRRRFNLAHELGHHLLADEYTTDPGHDTNAADRGDLINAFAAHFLMPAAGIRGRWAELSAEWDDPRSRLIMIAAEYRVGWSALITRAMALGLVSRAEFDLLQVQHPTAADYFDVGARFEEELRPVALAPAYSQAAVRAYRRSFISADRAVELLRDTVTDDELPRPHEMPIEASAKELENLG